MVKVSVSIVEDFARQDRNLINVLSVGVEDHLGTCHDASRILERQHVWKGRNWMMSGAEETRAGFGDRA
jgi:hypothetical protein